MLRLYDFAHDCIVRLNCVEGSRPSSGSAFFWATRLLLTLLIININLRGCEKRESDVALIL